ncbi:unannotated protein [freshwater metagenome]|uniref:Unannotated protein n=1 Tax=freshwater metagenome TaxID=449393 RepID=A0A6J6LP01_9ZZZZ|nr:DUF4012 domain-containing protein [Actinomycetota bacterium]MSY38533.1 DUF4012 domain-containing protein [Actinomycetota bacterium]
MSRLTPRIWLGVGAGVVVGLFVVWLQVSIFTSLASLGVGARSYQTSLQGVANQVSAGEYEAAKSDLKDAQAASTNIIDSAHGFNMTVLGLIPGINTAVNNWERLTGAVENITGSTGDMLTLFGDLSGKSGNGKIFNDGAIDIAALKALPPRVKSIDLGISATYNNLESVQANGPLSGPLASVQTKALDTIAPIQDAMKALVDLAPQLPDALGANGPRRYLIAIGNQAEMRASGGAPLTLILVEFDQGRITIPIKGQTSTELFPPLNAPVKWWGPAKNPFFDANPRFQPMVVTDTHPNFLYSAREMAGAWQGGGYPVVDGVVTIDLTAIGSVLNAMGPIQSPEYGEVTGDKLGQILLIDAYAKYGQADALKRQAANQALIDQLLTKLLSGDELVSAAKAMAKTAPGRHFQVWMTKPEFQNIIVKSGAGGDVIAPTTGDWSAIYTQNGNQSKVDVFQERKVVVNAAIKPDGSAHITQDVIVTNATPKDRPEGPPERIGYETSWLKAAYIMYVPDAAMNYQTMYPAGFAVRPFKNHPQLGKGYVDDGFGHKLVRVVGWTAPQASSTVSESYDLPAGTFGKNGNLTYTLQADPQSLFKASTITVRVTAPNGYAPVETDGMVVKGQTAEVSAVQEGPVNFVVQMAKGR